MSVENTLYNLTTSSGILSSKSVYFGEVNTQKLNGVVLSNLKGEGNDQLTPFSYPEIESVANGTKAVDPEVNKVDHDYDFFKSNENIESKGLPGSSTNPVFKNSAIGSKAGGIFGNQVKVISSNTSSSSRVTPMAVESNIIITDDLRARGYDYTMGESPENKRIRLNSDMEVASGQKISFKRGRTSISGDQIVTSQIGNEDTALTIVSKGIEVDGDIEMGNTSKIITSQVQADDYGALSIKADKIHFTANEITFDPESTEVTTGNFPQIIANLTDYESIQKSNVYTYVDPEDKSDISNAIFAALWRLQVFYNVIVCKIKFDKLIDETVYREKMGRKKKEGEKELYLHFPSDYYPHFCDFYGKEAEDYYITSTELTLENDEEVRTRRVGVYFNPKNNNFLKLRQYSPDGKLDDWPASFLGYTTMKIGQINFGMAVSSSRLKKQYQSTTPSAFMKKPDYYESITPKRNIKVPRAVGNNIYEDNIVQSINVTDELSSDYALQAVVNGTKIHKIAFFEVRFSFISKTSGAPVPFNDALAVLKEYKYNPSQFLITFIPSAENTRFACSDETNSEHIAKHPICGVKFSYNPKAPLGLSKGILDFSEARAVPSDDDVAMCIQFYHITLN